MQRELERRTAGTTAKNVRTEVAPVIEKIADVTIEEKRELRPVTVVANRYLECSLG